MEYVLRFLAISAIASVVITVTLVVSIAVDALLGGGGPKRPTAEDTEP